MITVMPCPFCGHDDVEIDEVDVRCFAVCCPECEAMGPVSRASVEDAIERWNAPHERDLKMDRGGKMTTDDTLSLAHREAWRYKKSSDPHHSDTYTFNRSTLLEFARKLVALPTRPMECDEEDAKIALRLAMQLFKQAQSKDEQCAYWFVSALSKLASTHPRRPVIEVLARARHAMPTAAQQYRDYVADKC